MQWQLESCCNLDSQSNKLFYIEAMHWHSPQESQVECRDDCENDRSYQSQDCQLEQLLKHRLQKDDCLHKKKRFVFFENQSQQDLEQDNAYLSQPMFYQQIDRLRSDAML